MFVKEVVVFTFMFFFKQFAAKPRKKVDKVWWGYSFNTIYELSYSKMFGRQFQLTLRNLIWPILLLCSHLIRLLDTVGYFGLQLFRSPTPPREPLRYQPELLCQGIKQHHTCVPKYPAVCRCLGPTCGYRGAFKL